VLVSKFVSVSASEYSGCILLCNLSASFSVFPREICARARFIRIKHSLCEPFGSVCVLWMRSDCPVHSNFGGSIVLRMTWCFLCFFQCLAWL